MLVLTVFNQQKKVFLLILAIKKYFTIFYFSLQKNELTQPVSLGGGSTEVNWFLSFLHVIENSSSS